MGRHEAAALMLGIGFFIFFSCGSIVTFVIAKKFGTTMSLLKNTIATLIAMTISGLISSGVIFVLTSRNAQEFGPDGRRNECCGLMEGGLVVIIIWLVVYTFSYFITIPYAIDSQRSKSAEKSPGGAE